MKPALPPAPKILFSFFLICSWPWTGVQAGELDLRALRRGGLRVSLLFRARLLELGDFISEPARIDIIRIPNLLREICRPLVYIDEFHQFRVQVWIAERAIGHQRVIEMLWIDGIAFEGMELR